MLPKDNKESPSRIETKTAYMEAADETLPPPFGRLRAVSEVERRRACSTGLAKR